MPKKNKLTENTDPAQPGTLPDDEPQPIHGIVARSESLVNRIAKFLKSIYVVLAAVAAILGAIAYFAYNLLWLPELDRRVIDIIENENHQSNFQQIIARSLLNIDSAYIQLVEAEIREEHEGYPLNSHLRIKTDNIARLAMEAAEISVLRGRVDSWHSFGFYRYFPDRDLETAAGSASIGSGALLKLSHDILVHPDDNLRLYLLQSEKTYWGTREINNGIGFSSLKVAGHEIPNKYRKPNIDGISLNCYVRRGPNSLNKAEDMVQVRVQLFLYNDDPNSEFNFNVYVVSSKEPFDLSKCPGNLSQ